MLEPGSIAPQPWITSFKLFKGTSSPGPWWMDRSYVEGPEWIDVGVTPIGSPNQPFLLSDMRGNYSSFYARIE